MTRPALNSWAGLVVEPEVAAASGRTRSRPMPKDLRKKAAGTLAAWMDRAGMGCNTFAELLGISSGSVRRWRCGAHQIAPQWLEGIERITLGELTRHDLRPDLFPREAD